MAEPGVVFGIGATKAGTSWLYRYLEMHPDCHFRAIKELHYFDMLEKGAQIRQMDRIVEARSRRRAAMLTAEGDRRANLKRQVIDNDRWMSVIGRGVEDIPAYLAYMNEGHGGARIVGDFTPSYALLPEARLRQMQDLAPDRVPKVKFIFLMRDPLERLWSNIRMMGGFGGRTGDAAAERARTIAREYLDGGQGDVVERSDYRAMLERMSAAIRPENLLIEFYERLFQQDTIDRICDFLGITRVAAQFDHRVNVSQTLDLAERWRRPMLDRLAPQYEFVANRFPDVPREWHANMVEV